MCTAGRSPFPLCPILPGSRADGLRVLPFLLVLLLLLLAGAAQAARGLPAARAACDWNAPGHNAFTGDVVAAVDAYQDIPAPVRARLQQRMAVRAYDDLVRIRRDGIEGTRVYRSDIRDMHFGSGQRCATVDRSRWSASAEERGLVYCESGHCILVPTVCRNVSRIAPAAAQAGAAGAGSEAVAAVAGVGPQPVLLAAAESPGGLAPAGEALALGLPADSAALPVSQVGEAATPSVVGTATGSGVGPSGFGAPPSSDLGGLAPWVAPGFPGLSTPLGVPTPLPGPLPAVPEPASGLLLLAGLAVLAWWRQRRVSPA